jgi:hypothetical protein
MRRIPASPRPARPQPAIGRITTGALILAIGVLSSLLIAIGCTALQDGDLTWTSRADGQGNPQVRDWLWPTPADWARRPSAYSWSRSLGYEADTVSWSSAPVGRQWVAVGQSQTRYRAGFPFPAFESRFQGLTGAVSRVNVGRFAWFGWERGGTWSLLAPTAMPEVVVPLMPYWPGFLADIFFYGIAGGGLLVWLVGTRRRIRRRRGECLNCGYALAGLTTCPECGAQTRSGV